MVVLSNRYFYGPTPCLMRALPVSMEICITQGISVRLCKLLWLNFQCCSFVFIFSCFLVNTFFAFKKPRRNYFLVIAFFSSISYTDPHYGICAISTVTGIKTNLITQRKYLLCSNIFCTIKIVINLYVCINNIIYKWNNFNFK